MKKDIKGDNRVHAGESLMNARSVVRVLAGQNISRHMLKFTLKRNPTTANSAESVLAKQGTY